jgi:hypothetical protein
MVQPIRFQCVGSLDFNWYPLFVLTHLTVRILNSESHKISTYDRPSGT